MAEKIIKFVRAKFDRDRQGFRSKDIIEYCETALDWSHGTAIKHFKEAKLQLVKDLDSEGKIRYYPLDAEILVEKPEPVELFSQQGNHVVGTVYSRRSGINYGSF